MSEFGKLQFSRSFKERVTRELLELCSRGGSLLWQTSGQLQTHGGCVSAMHIRHVANFCLTPGFVRSKMRYVVDFGCGVGQAVLTLANKFSNKTVYGIERDEARVSCLKARVLEHGIGNVDVVTCDWTRSVRDEAIWSFLSDVGFIFYNNFNCAGIADESFMQVVERYVGRGSIIICYSRLFLRERSRLVRETKHLVVVDGDHFSWMSGEREITVYQYEVV